jgi:hypothetical protein
MIAIFNLAIMGGMIYLMWRGLKAIILGQASKLEKLKTSKSENLDSEEAAYARARKYGRRKPETVDGGVIYPEHTEPEEVLLIEDKRQ